MIKTIAIIIVMIAANVLMVVSIRRSAARVDYSLRRHFALKLSNEKLINEEELKCALNESEEACEKEIPKEEFITLKKNDSERVQALSTADNVSNTPYKNKHLIDDYKTIKSISVFAPEYALACAKDIVDKQGLAITDMPDYRGLLDQLSFDTVCSLDTLSSEEQEKILRSCIGKNFSVIIDDFKAEKDKAFDCIDFYGYLKEMALIYSSGYSVISGEEVFNNASLKDGSTVKYDSSICEGSKVIYGNKVYDFSV